MKTYIVTVTYSRYDAEFSEIKSVKANDKPSAKRAAKKHYEQEAAKRGWENYTVRVEELTPAKAKAVETTLAQFQEQYQRINAVMNVLDTIVFAAKGYLAIE